MHEISICKVRGTHEERLKTFFSTGDYRCIVTEQQTTDNRNKDYRKEIAPAAFIIAVACHTQDVLAIHIDDSLVEFLLARCLLRLADLLSVGVYILERQFAVLELLAHT